MPFEEYDLRLFFLVYKSVLYRFNFQLIPLFFKILYCLVSCINRFSQLRLIHFLYCTFGCMALEEPSGVIYYFFYLSNQIIFKGGVLVSENLSRRE